jgi:hypothetical protein
MQKPKSALSIAASTAVFCAVLAASAHAQTPPAGGPYVLKRQAIAGGAQRASGGSYVLTGTVAQSVSGPSAGGSFALSSGFYDPQVGAISPDFRNGFEN